MQRYSLGLGPALFTLNRRGTAYSLGAIPLGGAVQLQGDNPFESEPSANSSEAFASQSAVKQALIVLAGPLANACVSWFVLFSLYFMGTHVPVPMAVGTVEPGSEAARAQLFPGDVILEVDGVPIQCWSTLAQTIAQSAGRPLQMRANGARAACATCSSNLVPTNRESADSASPNNTFFEPTPPRRPFSLRRHMWATSPWTGGVAHSMDASPDAARIQQPCHSCQTGQ